MKMKRSFFVALVAFLVLSSPMALADGGDLGSGISNCKLKAAGNVEGIALEVALEDCEHSKPQLFYPVDHTDLTINNTQN